MRLSGQGLMSHTATTTISRFFEKTRGRALSTTWLGLSLAEFILPLLIISFTYNILSKEKELGTLRLLSSQPISTIDWLSSSTIPSMLYRWVAQSSNSLL